MIIDQQKLDQLISMGNAKFPDGHFILNFYHPMGEREFSEIVEKTLTRETDFFYCCQPSEQFLVLALDKLISIYGPDRTDSLNFQQNIDGIKSKTVSNGSQFNLKRKPLFIGSLKFPSEKNESLWEDFNAGEWFFPKIILIKEGSQHYLVVNSFHYQGFEKYIAHLLRLLDEDRALKEELQTPQILSSSEVSFEEWSKEIDSALHKITDGTIQKVVLARYADFHLSQKPKLSGLLYELEDNYKECYTFAFRSGGSVFLGSSPEKLFSIHDGIIETDALAGSFPRGESAELDSSLENNLLNDIKNLEEHKSVVNFLTEKLSRVANKIIHNGKPMVKKFSNIQHLYTPIKAEIKEGVSAISVIENLHPTPAVCGMPSLVANQMIENLETFERGLYAGALGWVGLDNSAEMFVGIRSAIIKDNFMRAFAGCGIVNGSNSLAEFNETSLKLKPILSLFKNETINQS